MENSIYIGLSRQVALRRQLDVVANNIANMSTPGFKGQDVLFQQYMVGKGGNDSYSMVSDYGSYRDTRPGPVSRTDNPLDVAIEGDGFLVVETAQGPRYTRSGRMTIGADRQLVDSNGLPILGEGDAPIEIPENATEITIAPDGTISNVDEQIGRLRVVRFERQQFLAEEGRGLFSSTEPPQPVQNVRVHQGSLESSNVRPVIEMTRMIELQRQYQSTQRLLETEHENQRNAISKLSRLS